MGVKGKCSRRREHLRKVPGTGPGTERMELPVRAQQGVCLYFKSDGNLEQQSAMIMPAFYKDLSGCCT